MIDESAPVCGLEFVGTERRAGAPPALVITRLTGLINGTLLLSSTLARAASA